MLPYLPSSPYRGPGALFFRGRGRPRNLTPQSTEEKGEDCAARQTAAGLFDREESDSWKKISWGKGVPKKGEECAARQTAAGLRPAANCSTYGAPDSFYCVSRPLSPISSLGSSRTTAGRNRIRGRRFLGAKASPRKGKTALRAAR